MTRLFPLSKLSQIRILLNQQILKERIKNILLNTIKKLQRPLE